MATYLPSLKQDKQLMWDTAEEARMNSKVMFFDGPSVGWPTRTYLQQLCTDTGCSLEDLPVVVIYKAFCLDVAQGWINRAPNEPQTYSSRFANQAC